MANKFEMAGEAYRYCQENWIGVSLVNPRLFDIANAIVKIRKDQDKITRQAAIGVVSDIDNINPEEFSDTYLIDQDTAMARILNLKCV